MLLDLMNRQRTSFSGGGSPNILAQASVQAVGIPLLVLERWSFVFSLNNHIHIPMSDRHQTRYG